jgi:hypothetical protein
MVNRYVNKIHIHEFMRGRRHKANEMESIEEENKMERKKLEFITARLVFYGNVITVFPLVHRGFLCTINSEIPVSMEI